MRIFEYCMGIFLIGVGGSQLIFGIKLFLIGIQSIK